MSELPEESALLGQETALRALRAALAENRVAGAYLFHGPTGVGRSLGASIFAHALLCARRSGLAPCRTCRSCRSNAAGTHPDLFVLTADTGPRFDDDAAAARAGVDMFSRAARDAAKPGPRKTIAVRALRRLLELLSLASSAGGWKVVVLDAFDEVEEEGTALLLKTLEEAPDRTAFLLLSRGTDGVPDTILSRCQRVRFRPLEPRLVREIAAFASEEVRSLGAAEAERMVRLAQGSPGRAVRVAASGVLGGPAAALETLGTSGTPPDEVLAWVREGGRDLESQRERLRDLLALALLSGRDRWSAGGEAIAAAVRGAFESLEANVGPDWVLRGLWIRTLRNRTLTA